ncbi:ATP-binding protein [Persicitalea sp.]|uniref:hybrid sensor histidine kinase/response regulator n=1 Tax=Persicitalea sp. TaxID=3100273 RepID=UPI00359305C8
MIQLNNFDRRMISYFSISLGMLLILLSLSYTYKNLGHLSSQNLLVTNTVYVVNQTARYKQTVQDIQSDMRGYLITGDEELLTDINDARSQLTAISDTLLNLLEDDELQTIRIGEMMATTTQFADFSQTVITTYRTSGPQTAFDLVNGGQGVLLFKRISEKIEEIEAQAGIELTSRRNQFNRNRQRATMYIIITGIAGFGITLLSLYFLFIDRKKQQALKQEIFQKERLLNQYLEAIPDGIIVVNPEKQVTFINVSGRTMLGIAKNEVIQSLDELLVETPLYNPLQRGEKFRSNNLPICQGLIGNKSIGNRIDIKQGGEIVKFETNVEPIYELDGKILGAISTFRNVTEREAYAINLNAARNLAEQSLKTRDIFLSNVSHEIRTPLNAILGFTNRLLQEGTNGKMREYVGYIQIASRNLLELIDDLLDISKIEADQIVLDKRPTSITELIDSVGIIVKQKATEKKITYQQCLAKNLPETIVTDKLRLTQILLNLCGNAVKFTDTGSVKLGVKTLSQVQKSTQRIQFSITDTGIGIPEDRQEHIFNRFVQASETTSSKYGGTGLGLSITRALVKLLGGELKLESAVGKGTKFTLEFDFVVLHEPVSPEFSDLALSVPDYLDSLKILAAEDNALNQKLLQAIFDRTGAEVTMVNNGLEAIEQLEKESFDIVIMDVQMPIMDGYTAIQEIRNKLGMDIPIITLTAHAMVGEKEEGVRIGANGYISKPFKEADLLREIRRLTQKAELYSISEKKTQPVLASTQSLVDTAYLREITAGDQTLCEELIELFASGSTQQFTEIFEAMERKDYVALRKVIHELRSSLISVALLSSATKFQEIENSLISKAAPDNLAEMLSKLEEELSAGLRELKSTLQD